VILCAGIMPPQDFPLISVLRPTPRGYFCERLERLFKFQARESAWDGVRRNSSSDENRRMIDVIGRRPDCAQKRSVIDIRLIEPDVKHHGLGPASCKLPEQFGMERAI